ncbi:MAG: hypothetical protein VKL59_00360 [Nostocaceae cyanobacterium]|nr:hypothetical protein [Nostocaceae cyanobacterium]
MHQVGYESLRFPRTKAIVEASLRSAKMGELQNPLAVGFRNAFMYEGYGWGD